MSTFFTFPLPLLSVRPEDASYKHTVQRITSYCVVREGKRLLRDLGKVEVDAWIARCEETPAGYRAEVREHRELVAGLGFLNMNGGSVVKILREHQEAESLIFSVEALDPTRKKSPLVFVAGKLVWDCHDEGDPDWREFSVLCAVNSIIGMNNYRPVLIRRAMIAARACGYKSTAHYEAAKVATRAPAPLTTSQLRTTLDGLEIAGFFIRIAASPRRTYFATATGSDAQPQSRDRLRADVRERIQRSSMLAAERAKDRAIANDRQIIAT